MNKELRPIQVGDISISTDANVHIAGPCTVESFEQTFSIASNIIPTGINLFRGGAVKPRSDPDSFRGLGGEGLEILFNMGRIFNIPVVTEVLTIEQIDLIKKKSAGHPFIFQIGMRNARNGDLLEEVGKTGIPVLLKRGDSSTVKAMLSMAKYITNGGSPVIMCERGVATFSSESGTGRATADLLSIPQFQDAGFITIFDPSHAGGEPDNVMRLALAGIAVGANGLIVEVGVVDENGKCHAQCDAKQALSFDQFGDLLQKAKEVEQVVR